MTIRAITVISTALTMTLAGCVSTDPMTGSSRNQLISVAYGTVENVQQIEMAPNYGAGSLIGGALGLLAASSGSTGTQIAGAAAGAGLGALVSRETAGTAQKYTVRLVAGNTVDIVTDSKGIRAGDCVTVEQGQHANIRRVSPVHCSTSPSHPAYESMNKAVLQESSECQEVKQELLNAKTEAETKVAYSKMRAFCES